jgi:hypothetical protein
VDPATGSQYLRQKLHGGSGVEGTSRNYHGGANAGHFHSGGLDDAVVGTTTERFRYAGGQVNRDWHQDEFTGTNE